MSTKSNSKLSMEASFPHLMLSLCVDSEHRRTSNDLSFLASDLTSPASSAHNSTDRVKIWAPCSRCRNKPKRWWAWHLWWRKAVVTAWSVNRDLKVHLELKCWSLWLEDRDPRVENSIEKGTKLTKFWKRSYAISRVMFLHVGSRTCTGNRT